MKTLFTVLVFLIHCSAFAQRDKTLLSTQAADDDSLKIKITSINYVEGFYMNDAKRMASAIHAELTKRIIMKDDAGNMMIKNMGFSELLYNTKKNKNTNIKNPTAPFEAKVKIYEIYKAVATAKVVTNKFKFIDYLHLAKIDGEWKIVNVLWEFAD